MVVCRLSWFVCLFFGLEKDGAVIVGSVDGSRLWGKVSPP
jgi:hypothetical protein